jgi:hypothetical protein
VVETGGVTATTGQTTIDGLAEEVRSPVQPSFALHEIEEEDPGEVEQREMVALF